MKRLIGVLFFPLAFFFFLSCAVHRDWATRIQWDELEFSKLPDQEDCPDADAVILLDEGRMEIFGDAENGFSEFKRHRILKVFHARGRRYANVAIPYASGTKVTKIRARTISSSGKITVLKKENIYDVNLYPRFIFYSDQRAKIFTFPAVENGSVLEYEYRVTVGSQTLWNAWSFQSDVPTLLSRFTVVKPVEWGLKYRVYGIDLEPDSIVTPVSSKATYVWEIRNVPALKSEFGMPPNHEVAAQIALVPNWIHSWNDVTKWYHELSAPRMKANKALRAFVDTLTTGAGSDEEKLSRIHAWIRERVRYIAVAIGIGGFQPHFATDVFTNQYGDCKDMTTLMVTMAKEAGIPGHQVIVSTWQNGVPDTTLPTPFQFNHVIAYFPTVGDSGTWIDATDKGCPFGQLPWYDQGLPVLIVGENGEAKIAVTPSRPPERNRTLVHWEVDLHRDGAADVSGDTRIWGAHAAELRESFYLTSKDALRQWLETSLAKQCSGAILDSFQVSGLDPLQDPMSIRYFFHTRTFAITTQHQMEFAPNAIFALQLPDYFRSKTRIHPIRFSYGSLTELHLTVHLPSAWMVASEPVSDTLRAPFGYSYRQWSSDSGAIHIRSGYLLNGKEIPPQQYSRFQAFLDAIRERDLARVVLLPAPSTH